MKVTLGNINTLYTVQKARAQNTSVSFRGADEFAKNPATQTYWEAKKALQKEYLPQIVELRNGERTIWKDVCDNAVIEQYKDKGTADRLVSFLNKINYLRDMGEESRNPTVKLVAMLDEMDIEGYFTFGQPRHDDINCVMVTSQDKKLAEDFIGFSEFWSKVTNPSTAESCVKKHNPYGNIYQFDFKKIKDVSDNRTLQKALSDTLKKSEENFQKTGRKTIINVENMDRLLSHETNSSGNIACMKNFMNKADRNHHELIIFAATDPSKFDPGTTVSHRIGLKFDLDKAGIVQYDLNTLKRYQNDLQPTIDNISAIYQEGGPKRYAIVTEMDRLKKEFKEKLAELNEKFPTKESRGLHPVVEPSKPPIPKPEPKIIKNLTRTQIGLMVTGALSALAIVGMIIYKKIKKTDIKNSVATSLPPLATPLQNTPQSATVVQPPSNIFTMQNFLNNTQK